MRELDIIIPAAGSFQRMKSQTAKCLTTLSNGESVIGRSVRLLHELYPCSKITVVTGCQGKRVKQALPSFVDTIPNYEFDSTNVAYSIAKALKTTNAKKVLIVYGDLIFSRNSVSGFLKYDKSTLLASQSELRKDAVGVTAINGKASQFSYGLSAVWDQITLLCNREKAMFERLMESYIRRKYLSYEIFNRILFAGGEFEVLKNKSQVLEINTEKDVEAIRAEYEERVLNEDFMQLHSVRTKLCS